MPQLTRRQFAAAAAAPFHIARAATRPPNLMMVIGDDHTYLDIGSCGSKQVATPNMDRLAAEGMRFTHAFTGTAMCSPMRQQLYTGIFPVRNGAYPNHSQIKAGIKTWPAYFQELGYRVGLAGKRHFGPPASYPFEFLGGGAEDLDFKALEDFVRRNDSQPYCVFVTSHQPHVPFTKGDTSRHPVSRIQVPPYWVDTPATRAVLSKYYAEVEHLDSELGQCLAIVDRSAAKGNTLVSYCSEQGIGFPFAKWTCYDLGLRESVLLRWPERVKAGSSTAAMVQGVDWLPTLLEAAGGKAPGGIDGRGFLPVLLGRSDRHATEVYGVHTTRGIILGSDCYPIRSIRTASHKLILNLNHQSPFRCIVMKDEEHTYWQEWVEKAKTDANARRIVDRYITRPAVELYDVRKDPFEQDNLAGMPTNRPLVKQLEGQLRKWMEQQGDRGNETEMLVKPHARQA